MGDVGDGRGWGQGAGNERRVACGQRVENPCPLLLSPCHEGERPQRKLGDREVKASLKGKGQSPLNPADPGLKVALEPWALSLESWHLPLQPRAALTWAEDSHPRALVDHRLLPDSSA